MCYCKIFRGSLFSGQSVEVCNKALHVAPYFIVAINSRQLRVQCVSAVWSRAAVVQVGVHYTSTQKGRSRQYRYKELPTHLQSTTQPPRPHLITDDGLE